MVVAKKVRSEQVETQVGGVPLRSGPPPKRAGKSSTSGKRGSNEGDAKGGSGSSLTGQNSRGTGLSQGGPQRLQRILASAGYGSRRQCEELITEGRVEVEGVGAVELGTQVDPKTARIFVDGNLLKQQRLVYFLLNKPPGVVTSNKDPQGRTLVVDLIQEPERVYPVGRLDRSSEGLLLMTNDGDLAQQLAHPKYGVRKIYRVTVAGKIDNEKLARMKKGIYIAEGHVAVDGAKILRHRAKSTELEIVLREGKNREIRRILARLGHKVMSLQRIAIGPLRMADLPRGAYRPLKADELRRLREEVFYQSRAAKSRRSSDDGDSDTSDSDSSASFGRSKKSAKSKPGKRTGSGVPKRASAGKASAPKGAGGKRPAKKNSSGFNLDLGLEGSKRVGTVIGDESKPKKLDSERSAGKKKSVGKKRIEQRRPLKKSAKKRRKD